MAALTVTTPPGRCRWRDAAESAIIITTAGVAGVLIGAGGGVAVELRVHGTGGPTAASVLPHAHASSSDAAAAGAAPDGEYAYSIWRSGPDSRAAVRQRRRDSDIAVYHWAPLTSGSKFFMLWPLLLPFTLVNVAGWMHPRAGSSTARSTACRVLVDLIGYSVTLEVVGFLSLAGQVIARDTDILGAGAIDWLPGAPATGRAWLGVSLTVVALALIVFVSAFTAHGFERYTPPGTASRSRRRNVLRPATMPGLDNAGFFDDGNDHKVRFWSHLTVGVVGLGGSAFLAVQVPGPIITGLADLGTATMWLACAQLVLLGLLFAVSFEPSSFRRPTGAEPQAWRISGPFGAAALGVMFAGGGTTAALLALVGVGRLPGGPALMLASAYGYALGAGALTAAAVLLYRLLEPVEAEAGPEGAVLLGGARARRLARLARVPQLADLVVSATTLVFVMAAALEFILAFLTVSPEQRDRWHLTATSPVNIGRVSFLFVIGWMFLSVVKSHVDAQSLRRVGNVWDVLTFWPRTFHPFAVRPYTERAVPELQRLLGSQCPWDHVDVSAHSQGSVLVFATLLPMAVTDLNRLSLATFGCPLRSIYARAFPHYVRTDLIVDLEEKLRPSHRWSNFYRYTDYIGRTVFNPEAPGPPPDSGDVALPDPPSDGAPLVSHSGYWDDPAARTRMRRNNRRRP